ncbi:hypothetical protein E4K10_43680 [Streptomyces sp. T1317-0309]|nr:hypothetical protein E4K10_43680 [Streptomyces sp. T1317-0309]
MAPLDLTGTVVTFDALHSVKANIPWLVEAKKAHYIAVIKTNQPTAHAQLPPCPGSPSQSSTPPPGPDTDAASPARSRPAGSPTNSAESPFPRPPGHPHPSPPQADRPA